VSFSAFILNRAKLFVKPSLILNDSHYASLQILENTKITLMTINKVDNVRQSRVIENVIFKEDEDYVVEF
jgi:hypothetical protein